MSITIKELANLANTSTATVSRVLSNKPGVAEDRRQRILELAERLGYSPNRIARNLATQRSQTLGFIAADLANPVYIDFLHRIQTYLEEKGYAVLVADSKREVEKERANVELMREHRTDGLIIFPVHDWHSDTDLDHLLTLKLANFPFVLLGKVEGFGFDWVTDEELQTAHKLVELLAEHGHRRIGFVGRDESNRPVRERLKGVLMAAEDHGMELREEHIIDWEENWQLALKRILAGANRPSALVMVNDTAALASYRPVRELGLRIPDDLSLVAFGDSHWSSELCPSLTCTRADTDRVAKVALEILMQKIEEPGAKSSLRQREIPQIILPRESLAAANTATKAPSARADAAKGRKAPTKSS